MSLDIWLEGSDVMNDSLKVTSNLAPMADLAKIYQPLWYPEKNGVVKASDLLPHLSEGLRFLVTHPTECEALNPENGFGNYEILVQFVAKAAIMCARRPEAIVKIWR